MKKKSKEGNPDIADRIMEENQKLKEENKFLRQQLEGEKNRTTLAVSELDKLKERVFQLATGDSSIKNPPKGK